MRRAIAARRADWIVVLGAMGLLLAWDASGLDWTVTQALAGPSGFAWRDAWSARTLLHDGGRLAAFGLLLALAIDAGWASARPSPRGVTLSPAQRWGALAGVLLNLAVVQAFKRTSATSCPWDLADFGGRAVHRSHWDWGIADGGPGHCFPSGHAAMGFAFVALYFAWRGVRPGLSKWWLLLSLGTGTLFGAAQVLRGAHHVSHVAWTAWICWTVAATVDALTPLSRQRVPVPEPDRP